ncbi:MAG: hypothetical protein ACFFDN_46960, partial [Candidatus Hodarchaeota archaeon]
IDKKNGEKTFLLKLILSDNTTSIPVVLWDMDAINCLKRINEGDRILISLVYVKYNSYIGQNK